MPLPEDGPSTEEAAYDAPPSFDPYDPPETKPAETTVQPTSPGPAQSSDTAPGIGDTSGADGQVPDEEPPAAEPLPEFNPKHRDPFEGLLYLGRLQKTFKRWGHEFTIRTLTTEDMAEIGLIVRDYQGSQAENAVYQTAVVAAAIVTVDGQPLPQPITIDTEGSLTSIRFPYVLKNWLPAVREGLFWESHRLETEVRQVLAAMGEASG
jgi:hypothetical protein